RYKVNPKGFMSRISTSNKHEPVRVSKTALEEGLSFAKVARLFLDAYKAYPEVITVQVSFVTLPNFNYNELARLAQKNDEITTALDHILRDVKMDCASCKLQSICNEVEGMKELHFTK
ncbi:MAG: dehydrogenase/acetyl-CoA synthase beta subunit, partial [Clostridiales bacterium]|nr:dehydrogenase/acetyl-CoA synthase beta subunit [Clostridiales bacterium]